MPADLRTIAGARHALTDQIKAALLPLERSSHAAATDAALCVVSLLEGHSAAALSPTTGSDVIELVSEAARLAAQSRGKVMQAHERLRVLAGELNLPMGSGPECPPNEGGDGRLFTLPIGQAV